MNEHRGLPRRRCRHKWARKFTIGNMRVRLGEGNLCLGEALRLGVESLHLGELEGFKKNGGPASPPRLRSSPRRTRTVLWWVKTLTLKTWDSLLWSIAHLIIKNHLGHCFLSF